MIQTSTSLDLHAGMILAQETQEATGGAGGAGALGFIFPLLIMGGLFYFLLILPQRRRHKKMETMRSEITVGDEVRTIGGIIARVVAENDDEFTIDIGGQKMRIVKRAVAEKLGNDRA